MTLDPSFDFPAAHSMDTMWFAVDHDGHVAVFSTGEAGAIPEEGFTDDAWSIERELRIGLPKTGSILSGDLGGYVDPAEGDVADHGIFHYNHTCENWISGPYAREGVPAKPVKVGDLPPLLKPPLLRFEGSFASTERIQPAAIWECESWEPAWLDLDDKSVHPFPGREDEYEQWKENLGDATEGLIFE